MSGLNPVSAAPTPMTPYQEMLGRLHSSAQRLSDTVRGLETQLTPMLQSSKPIKNPMVEPIAEASCAFLTECEELLRRLVFLEEILEGFRVNLIL